MIPREQLDIAPLPDGGELRLVKRGQDYFIMFGRNELMSSRVSGSEKALATLTHARIRDRAKPRILIGGLGMGFTLRAAQAELPPKAVIEIAELLPKIVEWARGPLAHIFGDCLDDPRVTMRIGDVAEIIVTNPGYDAILLDVDNGPEALIHSDNDQLYSFDGLRKIRTALSPGGVLAIWSAFADTAFTGRLKRAGFTVEEVEVRSSGGRKGAHHRIWLAVR